MSDITGVIESFSQVDAVGTIRLDDGREVRFGRSACRFEPVKGTRVVVLETTAGFRGALKATAIDLGEDRVAHASRVGARDATLGMVPGTLDGAQLASTGREIGGLTILFDEEVPREIGALLGWALGFDLRPNGITVEVERSTLVFDVKGTKVRALVGHDPYPAAEVDPTEVGPGFSMGKSAMSLLFSFMPRAYYTRDPDAWLPSGHARAMSRLAKVLLTRGAAVIVHRAGEKLIPGPLFVDRLGDLDNFDSVPFRAWVEMKLDREAGMLSSVGLRSFGLPEVRVMSSDPPGSWGGARRFEAAVFACYCLCRGMWIKDGLFEVPRRIQIGATSPAILDPVDVERWDAKAEGAGVDLTGNILPMYMVLRPRDDSDDVRAMWARASIAGANDPSQLGHGGYEALYLDALMSWLHLGQVGISSRLRARVPHRMITLRGDGRHVMITTSGIGRVAQPGGQRNGGSDHVEIAAFVPSSIAHLVSEILGVVAEDVHGPERRALIEPWGIYPTAIATFLLRPWGPVQMGPGAPIAVLEMVPLDPSEASTATSSPASRPQLLGPYDQAASATRWTKIPSLRPA